MTDGGLTKTEAWNLQLQAKVDRLQAALDAAEKRAEEWKEQAYVWEIRARNDEARADAAERALADALAAKDTAEAQVAVLSQIRPSLADDLKSAAREARRQNMTWWTSLFGEAGATLASLQASRTSNSD
jgi:hypothetical protein